MITYTIYKSDYKSAKFKIQCLSTDQKPIGNIDGIKIRNGSKLYELNTGKKYAYDEQNDQWCEFSSSSSGGQSSGGNGGNFYIDVAADYNYDTSKSIDGWRITSILTEFTFNDIVQKVNQGINIYIRILYENMNFNYDRSAMMGQVLLPFTSFYKTNAGGGLIMYQLTFIDTSGLAAGKYSHDKMNFYVLVNTDPSSTNWNTFNPDYSYSL